MLTVSSGANAENKIAAADVGFCRLLADRKLSLAVSLVPGGLALIGTAPTGGLSVEVFPLAGRTADETPTRVWGIAADRNRLVVAGPTEVTIYSNSPLLAAKHPERAHHYDAFFTPRVSFFTGACMVHDIVIGASNLTVAATTFSAVCALDGRYNFDPIWHPRFISAVVPEDRCHLNGIAVEDGVLRYVTAFGAFDAPAGWRKRPLNQGLLLDVQQDRPLCEGLLVPHSPRLFDGRLMLLESGNGAVLEVDRHTGERRTLAQLPGFTRGFVHHDGVLFVGISRVRPTSEGFPLPVAARHPQMLCGIAALDGATGEVIGMLEFRHGAQEVFDLAILPGIACAGVADLSRPGAPYLLDSRAGTYWMQPPSPLPPRAT